MKYLIDYIRTIRAWSLVLFISVVLSQGQVNSLSPAVAHWKTLSNQEKETFVYSYLVQVYETHKELEESQGYGEITQWYFNNRAETVYGIFDRMHENKINLSEMVKWIDEYYSHGEYANSPFFDALVFALRFSEASGSTMWEKYENLKFDKIKPGEG
ncbi:MAG: hypothetical protein CMG62_07225 [Candidatus Marinimicrobia bacterium]|nr:hypothetical protein [Candidatus Neomarinimicrobiota bacterium]|tara:strand:+ start:10258 stop:10728 length:471 start_codon:yes stop_codon:yes gene_type:complete